MFFGSGENMLSLILIGAGAGAVIGVMNITGLGFSISLVLAHVGEAGGLFSALLVTAAVAIVLGMGMPTAAVYVVLSIILAPSVIKLGVSDLAAHLFIFYFGLLSFLTPPVAVASYVAAGLAGSDMWRTGLEGMKLAAVAYLLPFLWAFNPALILDGTPTAIVLAVVSAAIAACMLARALQGFGPNPIGVSWAGVLAIAGLLVGSSTVWLGPESIWVGAVAIGGLAVLLYLQLRGRPKTTEKLVAQDS
jgi:TRAP-type uncharacterized transport system fused permease subunit